MSLAYCFTIGPGELSRQGIFLLRSIVKNTEAEKKEIFVFVVEEEKDDIEDDILEEVDDKATLIQGEMPNEEYPLSAAHGALKMASEVSDKDYLLLLDTDMLVLDDIEVHERIDRELFLTPATVSHKFWNSKEKSNEEFRSLFDKYGYDYPEDKNLRSNYGREEINPHYNGGFILTKNNDFPERWLNLSKEVHGKLPKRNISSEMVSLSMLATEYETEVLGPEYNLFLALRPYPQEGTKIVHYVETNTLYRGLYLSEKIGSGWFKSKLEDTGILEGLYSTNKIKRSLTMLNESYYSYNVRIKGRETLNYRIRKKLIYLLEVTDTKNLARNVANFLLREERFKEDKYD